MGAVGAKHRPKISFHGHTYEVTPQRLCEIARRMFRAKLMREYAMSYKEADDTAQAYISGGTLKIKNNEIRFTKDMVVVRPIGCESEKIEDETKWSQIS